MANVQLPSGKKNLTEGARHSFQVPVHQLKGKHSLKDLEFWPRFPTIHGSIDNVPYTSKHTTETLHRSFHPLMANLAEALGGREFSFCESPWAFVPPCNRREFAEWPRWRWYVIRNIKWEEQGTLIYSLARKMHSRKGNKHARETNES